MRLMNNTVKKYRRFLLLLGMLCGIVFSCLWLAISLLVTQPWKDNSSILVKKEYEESKEGPLTFVIKPLEEVRPISPLIYGSNLTAKTEFEMDVAKFGQDTGITIFRFPGGGALGYRWMQGKFDFDERYDNAPLANIENAIKFSQIVGANLMFHVNLESGTPEEAAAWVRIMIARGVRVTYWELGNEPYGNWERDFMAPEAYVKVIKQYSEAMKAVDPSIKIGVAFGGPNYVFFDEMLVKEAADHFDFVSYHWYPNHTNTDHREQGAKHPIAEVVMANSLNVGPLVKRVDDIVKRYAPHRKGHIEVAFLEWDGSWDAVPSDLNKKSKGIMWSLANAIFYADTLAQFAVQGVSLSTQFDFQEVMFGLIDGWDKDAGWGGSRWDGRTIRPKALALKMFARYFGDVVVASDLKDSPHYVKNADLRADSYVGKVPYVSGYASIFKGKKKLAFVLINRHPEKNFSVKVIIKDVTPASVGRLWIINGPNLEAQNDGAPDTVTMKNYSIRKVEQSFDYKVPAHSVNMFQIDY